MGKKVRSKRRLRLILRNLEGSTALTTNLSKLIKRTTSTEPD